MSSVTDNSAKYAQIAVEEGKLAERIYDVASKLTDNSLYHVCVFSDNIVATSVVVNSTALNSKTPEKVVFHLVTNAMKSWFAMNMDNLRGVTVEVQKFEDFKWLNASYVPVLKQLTDNSLYHVCVFSDNIVATSVVVNSTALNSKAPEKVVFHLVTNAMKSWFAMNMDNLRGVTVDVQKFDDFNWLNASYVPVLKKLQDSDTQSYYFSGHNDDGRTPIKFRNPKYLSTLNHLNNNVKNNEGEEESNGECWVKFRVMVWSCKNIISSRREHTGNNSLGKCYPLECD
ncbi:hypothetical protein F2Q69_00007953 [Brassica cretica]|uniref:Hexosyltransferase n=1 Tax=Brassica cretica TaxID=69181 RepID=A0A8S9P8P1_BRACR|nr:hypothetical protein F2Q69_00007953 [Brassica cretica]